MRRLILIVPAVSLCLAACGSVGRIKEIGKTPPLSASDQLTRAALAGQAAPAPVLAPRAASASLYTSAAAASLFRDQRAREVGDLLTINVAIDDNATYDNSTTRSRNGTQSGGVSALFGLEKVVKSLLGLDTGNLLGAESKSQNSGTGKTSRSEKLSMKLGAVVVGVLPTGNLVIKGTQEARVNFELRELVVMGVVRPQDIAADNSIRHDRIAELRMSYGGKGALTEAQQARWGQQLIEAVSPF